MYYNSLILFMEPQTMTDFVIEKIQKGFSKQMIKEQLVAVGWSEDEADSAYAEALVTSGVPVPEKGVRGAYTKTTSTAEIVINFFSFILLGIVTTALGTLYFAVINDFFPDALNAGYSSYYYSRISDTIHYAIAALIIGYPMYFLAVRLWFKKFRLDETKVESKLTKWLTYLVLLASSVTIVGDLIYTLYTFLQGEISVRFFLKALTVIVIAGMIFGFYYLERKKVQYKNDIPRSVFKRFGYVLTGIVVLGIILGFVVAGSPTTERNRTFDTRRANDLASLADCLNNYAQEYNRLPSTLDEFTETRMSRCAGYSDPETKQAYEYQVISPLSKNGSSLQGEFELCAVFSLAQDGSQNTDQTYYYGSDRLKWETHTTGRNCDREKVTIKIPPAQVVLPQGTTVTPIPTVLE